MNTRAQGAIEYLLIMGAAILVVAIVILAVTGVLGGGKSTANSTQNDYYSSLNSLRTTANIITPGGIYLFTITTASTLDGAFGSAPNGLLITIPGTPPTNCTRNYHETL